MYNLSGIQKGIQAGHAALEYVLKYGNTDPDVHAFMRDHKTFILLNGGTSRTMHDRVQELIDLDIPHASFNEPDLNDSISAIAFLVHECDYVDPDPFETNPVKQYLRRFSLASN
jgi:hypothetical protein